METLTVSYKNEAGLLLEKRPLSELQPLKFYRFLSVREIKAYKDQPNKPGYFFMFKMGELVAYESRQEMKTLMRLDFDPSVRLVCSQPFAIHYGPGYTHFPDYFVWYENGRGELINVKPKKFQDTEDSQRDFKAADRVCKEVGWRHVVQGEASTTFQKNLDWLTGFRRKPPQFEAYARKLLGELDSGPLTIGALIKSCGPSYAIRPVLFHLMWLRFLEFDMENPLTETTVIDLSGGILIDV